MTPETIALIRDALPVLTTIFTAIMAYLMARLNQKAKQAENIGKATHALVNSSMGTQLELNAIVTAELAARTGDPAHMNTAKLAKKALLDHDKKQQTLDRHMTREQQRGESS